MNRKRQLEELTQLSGLQFSAAQAKMANVLSREAALRQNLEQLTQSKQIQAAANREPDEAALIAGADIRWHQWVDQRRTTINTELAQVLVLKESCRQTLKHAFGRDQASLALKQKNSSDRKQITKRKQNYES